jgi:RimJ/RimL family protein N-acetyltransferase
MNLFETERLAIRRFDEGDAAFVLASLNDPGFLANIGDRGVRTIADARAYIRERYLASYRANGFGLFRVALRDCDTPIGSVGLVRRDGLDGPDLGFAFLAAHVGRGYGGEAARAVLRWADGTLAFPELLAITAPDNAASAGLLRKLGFLDSGRVRVPGYPEESLLFTRRRP